jgi:hypothetical protein
MKTIDVRGKKQSGVGTEGNDTINVYGTEDFVYAQIKEMM